MQERFRRVNSASSAPDAGSAAKDARFTRLLRGGAQIGAEIEYSHEEGTFTRFLFYDEESLRSHIEDLELQGRDTAEEHAALSALIVAGKE